MTPGRVECALDSGTFYIRKFPPLEALSVLGTLQKSLLSPLLTALKARSENGQMDMNLGAQAITELSQNMDGPALVKMAKLLLNPEYISVLLPGANDPVRLTEGPMNIALPDVSDLLLLCVEVVKVNYSGFGQRAQSLIGEARSGLGITVQ